MGIEPLNTTLIKKGQCLLLETMQSSLDASCESQGARETIEAVADAKVIKRRWSKAEDMMILKQRRSGASWDAIAVQLDERTADGVRLRWHRVKRDSALLLPDLGDSTPIGKREKKIQWEVWTGEEDARQAESEPEGSALSRVFAGSGIEEKTSSMIIIFNWALKALGLKTQWYYTGFDRMARRALARVTT